jgi:DNA-binding response OmpR family regulator
MPPKVMLFDDDDTMLSLLQTLLELEGYQVVIPDMTDRVESLVENISREKPELLLLDVHLNHISGLDVLRRLRQSNELKSIHVLMTSGMDLSHECCLEDADGFLMKPYMAEDLMSNIKKVLGT